MAVMTRPIFTLTLCLVALFFFRDPSSTAQAADRILVTAGNFSSFRRFHANSPLACYADSQASGARIGVFAPFPLEFENSFFRAWSSRKALRFSEQIASMDNAKLRALRKKKALYKGLSRKKFSRFIDACDSFKAVPAQTPVPTVTATPTATGTPTPSPTPPITQNVPRIALQAVVSGLNAPLYMTHSNDSSGRLFIVEQGGRILVIKNGALNPTPYLDIATKVTNNGEQGLLSVAFHPLYAQNGRLFVNYIDTDGDTVVSEYSVSSSDADRADQSSERIILTVEQPATNHNGGLLKFGPDGFLYIAMGDGGGGGDPFNNGQNLNTLHGSLLRINIDGAAPYQIPADNPFISIAGAKGEAWAYGLRNPWRFSFDRSDGRLFIADVGQGAIEEVDIVEKGDNLGWRIMEGSACYNPSVNCNMNGLKLPIAEYDHSEGQSITGGYVYRGASFPDLYGKYIFGDFISRRIWVLIPSSDGTWRREFVLRPNNTSVASFGEDQDGNLYLVAYQGTLYKIVEEPAPLTEL